MTKPNFKNPVIDYDVLVIFSFSSGLSGGLPFRFSLHRTVDQPNNATWRLLGDMRGAYYGLIKSITPLRAGFGTEVEPTTSYPTTTIIIADDDGSYINEFKSTLEEQDFGKADSIPVGIFLVEKGTTPDPDTDFVFEGHLDTHSIKFRQEQIEVNLTDKMKKYDIEIPQQIFSSESSIIDPAWRGKPKPILFGDWSDPRDSYQIQSACINTDNASENLDFQLSYVPSGLSISSFGSYVRRVRGGSPNLTVSITNTDPALGTFEASGTNDTYYSANYAATYGANAWEEGDKWYVYRPKGLIASGSTIENPAVIWYHILEKLAGVGSANIDSASFIEVYNRLDQMNLKGRRWITKEQKLSKYLDELCFEFGLLWFVRADKFVLSMVSIEKSLQAGQTWYGCNILKDRFDIRMDPASWIVDGILLQYKYNPRFDTFNSHQTAGGSPHKYRKAYWIWDQDSAATRAGYFSLTSSRPPKLLKTTAINVGLESSLADKIAIERLDESADEFQIFNISQDFGKGLTEIEAYSLSFNYGRGAWTDDDAPDWPSSDSYEREQQGFWADGPIANDGDCDPATGNQEENDSNWTEG